nr:EOG090X0EPP [Eulimnadia texana]
MAGIFCCLRSCMNGIDLGITTYQAPVRKQPAVSLDSSRIGQEVVLVKNGSRICGTGGALGTAPLVQNQAYFEVKLQQSGVWGVGVAVERVDLDKIPLGSSDDAWTLCSDGIVQSSGKTLHSLLKTPQEGDVVGISYNHIELNFYLNGTKLDCPVTNVRGTVYPAFYVDEGAILDVSFEDFTHGPPPGYERIMLEQSVT